MFDLIAKKISDDELIETIRKMREGNRSEKNKAFVDLRDTYDGLLRSKYNSVKSIASNSDELEKIRFFIESSFVETLLEKGLTMDSVPQIKRYFTDQLGYKVTKSNIEEELGKSSIMKDVAALKTRFKRAVSKYRQKYHKKPDLIKDQNDIKDFAEIMGVKEEKIPEILKKIGPRTIQSIFEEIGGEDGVGSEILLDTLKNNEPLPDEILKNKELMKVIINEAKNRLTPIELKVFIKYYNPGQEHKKREEIAEELGIPERQVRDIIDRRIKEKLMQSPKLKDFASSSIKNRFVLYAMNKFKFDKISSIDYENIIKAIITQN